MHKIHATAFSLPLLATGTGGVVYFGLRFAFKATAKHYAKRQLREGLLGRSGTKSQLWSSTKSKSAVENAFGHFKKHKSEFPEFQNAKQYVEGTKRFLNSPPKGTLTKINSRGDILRYESNTNTFGVMSKDGVPRTMFRPKDGIDYWNRQ